MKIDERIKKLREEMKKHNIDYYLIPSSDYHLSEYVDRYFKGREWISGFTGSAGTVIVSEKEAILWTDGRYFIQAENQLKGTEIKLFKMGEQGVPTVVQYILENLKCGEKLGFDGKVVANNLIGDIEERLKEKNIDIVSEFDLLANIWEDRGELPCSKAFVLDIKYCGETFESKISKIREKMEKESCDLHIITSLDDIAWIFNLRGRDVANNPVNLAYSIITLDKTILYINEKKLDNAVEKYFYENEIEVRDYFEIYEDIKNISSSHTVMLDYSKVNYSIVHGLDVGIKTVNCLNPSTLLKSSKNPIEIENLRNCHIKDGVAVTKFMYWLKNNINGEKIDEISASEKLEEFRKEQELYIEPSFDTICAYKENAAMMHYKATKERFKTLEAKDMLLVDSGGQYFDGTTDITRTFILGETSKEAKEHFTLVLKGMINLSKIKFLYGITGTNLDILARQFLWQKGIDYKCGTGHGVGFLLNVHEGPQSIRWQYNNQPFEEGMNITNEPGVYLENQYGIRLENELVVKKAEKTEFGQFMEFETITYAPIDLDGVVVELLTEEEKNWLNNYHKNVYEKLEKYLNSQEREWLKKYTGKI